MKYPKLEGVGTHLNINPKDNDFMQYEKKARRRNKEYRLIY